MVLIVADPLKVFDLLVSFDSYFLLMVWRPNSLNCCVSHIIEPTVLSRIIFDFEGDDICDLSRESTRMLLTVLSLKEDLLTEEFALPMIIDLTVLSSILSPSCIDINVLSSKLYPNCFDIIVLSYRPLSPSCLDWIVLLLLLIIVWSAVVTSDLTPLFL